MEYHAIYQVPTSELAMLIQEKQIITGAEKFRL